MKPSSKAVLLVPAIFLPLMGLFPALTMDKLADLGQGFFTEESLAHAVHRSEEHTSELQSH